MSHCGFWLEKAKAEFVKYRLKRLMVEKQCYQLAKECYEAIKRLDEKFCEVEEK